MKLKESELRQIIKNELLHDKMIVEAMEQICNLLPIKCYVKSNNYYSRIVFQKDGMKRALLEYSFDDEELSLYHTSMITQTAPYTRNCEWLIKQSNCKSFDDMDQYFKNEMTSLLENEIAEIKDNIDVSIDLD